MKNCSKIFLYGFFLSMVLFLLTDCKSVKESTIKSKGSKTSAEDFNNFYNQFHKDSVFQKSRINFPLEGMFFYGTDKKEWTKENWVVMKTKIFDIDTSQYKIDYKKTENTFTQKFWLENSGFSSEYRFELVDNKWYLVYALDINF